MPWGKKKTIDVAQSKIAELRKLGKAFRCASAGCREILYTALQKVQVTNTKLEGDTALKRNFLETCKPRLGKWRKREQRLDMEIMVNFTGVNRKQRKRASKLCQVLRILSRNGVPPEKTADAIKRQKGIANIISSDRKRRIQRETKICDVSASKHARPNDLWVDVRIAMRTSDWERMRTSPLGTPLNLDAVRVKQGVTELQVTKIDGFPSVDFEDEEV